MHGRAEYYDVCGAGDTVKMVNAELRSVIHESYGGFAPGAVKLLHKLGSQHGAKLGHDELTAPWCARSFRSFHSMCISVALHRAAAEEIVDAVYLDTAADYGAAAH